jgi:hypothetical protein
MSCIAHYQSDKFLDAKGVIHKTNSQVSVGIMANKKLIMTAEERHAELVQLNDTPD